MKSINKKILIVLVTMFIFQGMHAEYLFYKTNSYLLTQTDNERLYPQIIRYTFPSNTNPLLTFNELSTQEKQEMHTHEKEFLQRKIGSDYGIQFIPTVLYELLILKLWTQFELMLPTFYRGKKIYTSPFGFPESQAFWNRKEYFLTYAPQQNPVKMLLRSLNEAWRKDANLNTTTRLKKSFDICNNLNHLPDVQQFHLLINNKILNFLKKQNIHITDLNKKNILVSLLHSLCDYFNQMEKNLMLTFSGVKTEETLCAGITDKNILEKALSLEHKAEKEGSFVLYRGTHKLKRRGGKIDSTVTLRNNELLPASLSYGNTLYAALFGDDCLEMGAMAYHYIKNGELGYAVLIDKHSYAHGNLQNLFFIPPLTTLIGLVSQGEFFHARSRAKRCQP